LKETKLNLSVIESFSRKAKRIYAESLHSLKSLINLFDSGTRTFYDLKHLSNPLVNPNVARWDYHSVHVSQLFYLIKISEQQNKTKFNGLNSIAKRWLGYCRGLWNKNSQISNRDTKINIE
jgi:heparosan-N-sulfate-glucuronate 5-epimerase